MYSASHRSLWSFLALAQPWACTTPISEDQRMAERCALEQRDPALVLEHLIDGQGDACELRYYADLLTVRGRHEGPWAEEIWVAWAPEGGAFDLDTATLVMEKAAVPEVILYNGGYWLFYGVGDLDRGRQVASQGSPWFRDHGLVGFGALDLATSSDGRHFEPCQDFAVEGLVRGMAVDPDLITLPDGSFRLYYVGTPIGELVQPGAWDDGSAHRVYYAESNDLMHWKQRGQAVTGPYADPSVTCLDQQCLMASTGIDFSWSSDGGRTFDYNKGSQIWGFAPEFTPLPGGALRLYLNSKHQGGALLSRRSDDGGRTWQEEPGERLPAFKVEAVSFAPAPEGGTFMYYHYYHESFSGPQVEHWGGPPKPTGER